MLPRSQNLLSCITALTLLLGAGCTDPDLSEPNSGGDPTGGKGDHWNDANDPANMGQNYVYSWDELNKPELAQGASEIVPWPDTYWPMKDDGYNHRWRGQSKLSPVELYDTAFNDWTPASGVETYAAYESFSRPGAAYDAAYYTEMGPAAKWAHQRGGNYAARVLTDPDGTPKWDEDSSESNVSWGGIAGWWGHCHAWAPAAFMAPEPQHAVTVEGVTFEVGDIKALIEATYEGGRSLFLGGRCNADTVERDEFGRIKATECRDTNAGAFHVVVLNRMGIRKKSFVIDATYDFQVWNQPVRDYKITQQDEISLEEALQLLGRTDVTEYPYNDNAKRFVHVKMNFRYVVEGSASATPYLERVDSYTRTHYYDYILELKQDGTIDGGEWVDDAPHPDFIWAPVGANDIRENGWGRVIIDKQKVQTLIDLSTQSTPPPSGNEVAFESNPALAIPDNDETGVTDTLSVEQSLTIKGLRVDVDIAHTYRGDLTVELVRGDETVTLVANEGGGADDLVKSFTVGDFNGQDATGEWSLRVRDNANIDTGTLNSWTLVVITD